MINPREAWITIIALAGLRVHFLGPEALGTFGQRYFGSFGVIAVSFLGGLVSSVSATAAAAKLASQGKITPMVAGSSAVLASISSAFVNLPIVYQATRDRNLVSRLAVASGICVAFGLLLMGLSHWLNQWVRGSAIRGREDLGRRNGGLSELSGSCLARGVRRPLVCQAR